MELRHLRYFVIVAEEQNVTRAAERLHVSQPPLSRQIRDLEEELGVKLFQRTAKSLTLTEAGKTFLGESRAVLLRAEKAVETVRAVAARDKGQLRIGYAPSLTVELLPLALREFEKQCPGVRVSLHDLSSEECVQRLVAKKIDLALTVRPTDANLRGLTFEHLKDYLLCCAVPTSHRLARKRSVRLEELRQERFVVLSHEEYPEYREWLDELFGPDASDLEICQECDSAAGLIAAVEAGQGVSMVPSSYKCVAGPRARLIRVVPSPPGLGVGALLPRVLAPWAAEFIAALKQAAS